MMLRILVVDDDPGYRELLKDWLHSEGHEAILAGTLEEGFVGIASQPLPDVVLLDVHLGQKTASPWCIGRANRSILPTCKLPLLRASHLSRNSKASARPVVTRVLPSRPISGHCANTSPGWRLLP